jgi:hypothetical protein
MFIYRVLKNRETYYLFQELCKKKPFEIWTNEEFWMSWFLNEIYEREKEKQNEFYIKNNKEDLYFIILIEMGTIMNDLNIDLKTVMLCIIEKIAVRYIIKDTKLVKNLEGTLIKQSENKKKEKE